MVCTDNPYSSLYKKQKLSDNEIHKMNVYMYLHVDHENNEYTCT